MSLHEQIQISCMFRHHFVSLCQTQHAGHRAFRIEMFGLSSGNIHVYS